MSSHKNSTLAMKDLISPEIIRFKEKFFPNTAAEDWLSWKWQLRNRKKVTDHFTQIFGDGFKRYDAPEQRLPFGVTPYYAAVASCLDFTGTLKKTILPSLEELEKQVDETSDPLEEVKYSKAPNIVHKYPDRVLFLTTSKCAVYCRYCTRGRLAGNSDLNFSRSDWETGVRYIQNQPEIREVIVSGGDPLLLADEQIEFILKKLRAIPHVQIIRLGTKVPVTLPQRITPELVSVIQRYHPVFVSLHVIHPAELTRESTTAIERLVNSGVVIASQSVLLKAVNDELATLKELMEKLLFNRIRPYALYHCDRIEGTGHFRTPLKRGVELVEGLRSVSSGYAMPHYVVDPPGGKVTLAPNNSQELKPGTYRLKNWVGNQIIFKDDL